MPTVKNVGEPCAGEPHARFDAAAGGNQASRQARAASAPPADPTATVNDGEDARLSAALRESQGPDERRARHRDGDGRERTRTGDTTIFRCRRESYVSGGGSRTTRRIV